MISKYNYIKRVGQRANPIKNAASNKNLHKRRIQTLLKISGESEMPN